MGRVLPRCVEHGERSVGTRDGGNDKACGNEREEGGREKREGEEESGEEESGGEERRGEERRGEGASEGARESAREGMTRMVKEKDIRLADLWSG